MATASETKPDQAQAAEWPDYDQVVTLENLHWSMYENISAMKGDRAVPRLIYNQGRLTLVSPSHVHEHDGDRLDRIVMAVCSELEIDCHPAGSTSFRPPESKDGVEGDKTYYIAREPEMRGVRELNQADLPPPDLVIEVEYTHKANDALEVWKKLGVPEAWVYNATRRSLRLLHRDEAGPYVESSHSRAFPFLSTDEITRWVNDPTRESESRWERRLREWVRAVLAPRQERLDDQET